MFFDTLSFWHGHLVSTKGLPVTDSFDKNFPVLYKGQVHEIRQTENFLVWLASLKDVVGRGRIFDRLLRIADGNFGDSKSVGDGVEEIRMHFGPGYRIYFRRRGTMIVLLLVGGHKDSQKRDIALACELAKRDDDGFENNAF